jgi:predicted  nucleic acid-binding Zn-ribbon protein
LMEAIEEQEELAHGLTGQRDKAAAERQERQRQLDEELARLRNELDQLQEQRELLAARIEPKQMQLYRDLARRHQGRGLARVINDICQGCSVFISSAQRGFLYDPEALVYCENCGRLLVRFTEEETRTDWVE